MAEGKRCTSKRSWASCRPCSITACTSESRPCRGSPLTCIRHITWRSFIRHTLCHEAGYTSALSSKNRWRNARRALPALIIAHDEAFGHRRSFYFADELEMRGSTAQRVAVSVLGRICAASSTRLAAWKPALSWPVTPAEATLRQSSYFVRTHVAYSYNRILIHMCWQQRAQRQQSFMYLAFTN